MTATYIKTKLAWSSVLTDWSEQVTLGPEIADPSGTWEYSSAESYINEKVNAQNQIISELQTDTVWNKAQTLTTAQKDQVAENIQNKPAGNGMGRIVLKATDDFKTIVEAQTGGNTVFVIKYDFTLSGDVTIPANCVLEFDGGSIHGDNIKTITFNNTKVVSDPYRIFYNVKFSNNYNEPDNINLLKNEIVSVDWFVNPTEDCGDNINNALSICRSLKLSNNITYIVNTTIRLRGNRSIIFGTSSVFKKTANPESPIIYITGVYNSISSPSKSSGLKSTVATPYGLIAVAEYGETIYTGMTTYNKVDGIRLEGTHSTDSTSLSVGMYCKGTYIDMGRYYNSFTNLYFIYFNVGIHILGDFNANFFRDLVFTYVGGSFENYVRDNSKEAAIVFESLFTTNIGWGTVLENSISQIFHTGSNNATTILFKGSVRNNILQAINSEVGGQQATTFKAIKKENEITHELLGSSYNIITMSGVNYQGSSYYEGFFNENIVIDGAANKMYTPKLIINECTVDTVSIKKNTFINNFHVEKEATYQVPNYKTFDICKIALFTVGDTCLLNIKIIDLAGHSYVSSREFRISIDRDGNGPIIRFIINSDKSDKEDNHYPVTMAKPKIDGNNIIIRGISPNIVESYSHNYSIYAECTVYDSYRASTFELFDTYTESDVQYQTVNINKIGNTSRRPTYPAKGDYYFDKDIQKLIFVDSIASDGTITWIDASGTPI